MEEDQSSIGSWSPATINLWNFKVDLPEELIYNELSSSDEELLLNMTYDDVEALAATTDVSNVMLTCEEMEIKEELTKSALDLPPPETPAGPPPSKRFETPTEDEIENMFENRQAENTKKNTVLGMRVFQDWHVESKGVPLDIHTVSVEILAEALKRFYAETRPKRKPGSEQNEPERYHKNTLINIRGAIIRYLSNNHRNIDIIRDKEFRHANGVLDGLLKQRARNRQLKPTKHKAIIENGYLEKISTYLPNAHNNPIILRHNVWYNLSIHFLTRGMEFQTQLSTNSFNFQMDESCGREYVTLNHSIQEKNHQGGINSHEAPVDRRMYSTNSPSCPVEMLRLLIAKSETKEGPCSLFCHYRKCALESPFSNEIWFTRKPLAKKHLEILCRIYVHRLALQNPTHHIA